MRRATQLEFYAGYHDGIYLLRELGDTLNVDTFENYADTIKAAALKYLLDAVRHALADQPPMASSQM